MERTSNVVYEPDLEIDLGLELETAGNDELFSFHSKEEVEPDKKYRPSEQQLIQEGKLGGSDLSARIKKATFGSFNGQPACLILIRVDFCPKGGSRSWFRFRSATIQADFSDLDAVDNEETSEASEEEDEEESACPLVLRLYPELIRGHVQTAANKYNIKGYVEPAGVGAGAEIGAEKTFLSEGLHLVHGRLVGDPETGAKWSMTENEVSRSGIYEQPIFAVIVRHEPEKGFAMKLRIKAITYGGLAVKGQKKPRITFKRRSLSDTEVLDNVDLEELTEMRAKLLGKEGPGGGRPAT
ncbi:MAG: hypothetical protein Q9191_003621 [Dirinaria sp. TL-2023a]